MALAKLIQEDRRLVILRVLEDSAGFTANESIIDTALDAYGHKVSRDTVLTEIHWLEEQGLISLVELAGTQVASLNQRGLDVAQGQAKHPGVKAPLPK
ncbi:ArsR family transcriptional regulator [Vibrio mediterranei]|uniref:VpaChn25_0724 family phage protein n=1 Tax=Vibrio mediterranei TaxID=689 RepID=UPI001EFEB50A|nr:ArsR family transcriptional regulator [Vibrio mediterranei]MCG9624626.1 ArsR family transcriptional regulator [Vibrio mediterranei]